MNVDEYRCKLPNPNVKYLYPKLFKEPIDELGILNVVEREITRHPNIQLSLFKGPKEMNDKFKATFENIGFMRQELQKATTEILNNWQNNKLRAHPVCSTIADIKKFKSLNIFEYHDSGDAEKKIEDVMTMFDEVMDYKEKRIEKFNGLEGCFSSQNIAKFDGQEYLQNINISIMKGMGVPEKWNLNNLKGDLQKHLKGEIIGGVCDSMTYITTKKNTLLPFNVGENKMGSISYLIRGAPRVWLAMSWIEVAMILDEIKKRNINEEDCRFNKEALEKCPFPFIHKKSIITIEELNFYNAKYIIAVQHPGEFIVAYPGEFHSVQNLGPNLAETINFTPSIWPQIAGNLTDICRCKEIIKKYNCVPWKVLNASLKEILDNNATRCLLPSRMANNKESKRQTKKRSRSSSTKKTATKQTTTTKTSDETEARLLRYAQTQCGAEAQVKNKVTAAAEVIDYWKERVMHWRRRKALLKKLKWALHIEWKNENIYRDEVYIVINHLTSYQSRYNIFERCRKAAIKAEIQEDIDFWSNCTTNFFNFELFFISNMYNGKEK